ncbi:hypothetical protein QBC39DRAFT_364171, partial [Podospora conica]
VAVGYSLTTILSPLLSLANVFSSAPHPLLVVGLTTYFECAAYFALAIQLASIVTMAKPAEDSPPIGTLDQQIASIGYMVALLPLFGPLAVLPQRQRADRRRQRLVFVTCVVLLSIYPFGRYFIIDAPLPSWTAAAGDAMTREDEQALKSLCYDGVRALSRFESVMVFVLRVCGQVPLLVFTLGAWVLYYILPGRNSELSSARERRVEAGIKVWCCAAIVVPACLGIPLVYAFWRLRGVQSALAGVVGGGYYQLNEWGYGQVMAVTVFAPVGVEMLFAWWFDEKTVSDGQI